MTTPEKTLSHLRAINYICLHSEGRRTGPRFVSVLELPQVCDQRLPMCPPWSACKGQPKRRGNTLLPLQGVKSPVILGYPGCRFACPGLSARWAFSPLCLMTPLYLILHVKLDTLINSPIRQFVKIFMNIAGYSWQLLTTSPSACGPIQSTDVKQI